MHNKFFNTPIRWIEVAIPPVVFDIFVPSKGVFMKIYLH